MSRVFHCLLPFLALAALAATTALPAAAQQFPSQQRGLSADTAYQSGELDSVNLFNGNLSLEVPLGQSYPVGPAFSLSFALQYNSKVWDYDEEVCQQTLPTQAVPYHLPQPDKFANAGLGWLLTPGRLLDPSTVAVENPLNPGPNWVYVSSDGGHHALYPRLFFYDANDERLFAWDCPQSSCNPDHNFERWTLRGLGGEVLRTFAGSGKFTTVWEEDFVYGPGSLLASIRPSATPGQEDRRYVAVDHLGSTRLVWNEQNQTLDRYDFHPFGQEVAPFAAGDPPLKFTGHERDQNGCGKGLLDYMHARYASPFTARFLSVDPVLGRPGQPQSWNRSHHKLPVLFHAIQR